MVAIRLENVLVSEFSIKEQVTLQLVSPLHEQKDLVSHKVYCMFPSVNSIVSICHVLPFGYSLEFLKHIVIDLLSDGPLLSGQAVRRPPVVTYFQVRQI